MDWGTAQEVGGVFKKKIFLNYIFLVLLGARGLSSGDHVCPGRIVVGHFSHRGNNLLARTH